MKKILMIHPEFNNFSFWNYKEVCQLLGAKYPTPPLGLLTVAALLPKDWEIKVVDLNATKLNLNDMKWADMIFTGGMLPQQHQILRLIDMAKEFGKKVVVGGPGPTSLPELYSSADYLVLGEAELSIRPFLNDVENQVSSGTYVVHEKPDLALTPIPRYDLIRFKDYMSVAIQYSRGCPFNCEFCDVIELYGRQTRVKSTDQIMLEIENLYQLGYRGEINFVDDNFIGNKAKAKDILLALKSWLGEHNHPFHFSTEVSINIAENDELLELMRDVDFRNVFIGIETPDEEALKSVNKFQNTRKLIKDSIQKIHSFGIAVSAGFIVGFDDETSYTARKMLETISESNICISMVGLLYALPNTQMTRRLKGENRLDSPAALKASDVDQTTSGLNFITRRPKAEILEDYIYIINEVYSTQNYFNRCLSLSKELKSKNGAKSTWHLRWIYMKAVVKLFWKIGLKPGTSFLFWRNILLTLIINPSNIKTVVSMMAVYPHFKKQTKFVTDRIRQRIAESEAFIYSKIVKKPNESLIPS